MTVQRDVPPIYVVHYQNSVTPVLGTAKNTRRLSVAKLLEYVYKTSVSFRVKRHS